MRLNGWQRIGVVASVVWAVAAFFTVQNSIIDRASRLMDVTYRTCSELKAAQQNYDFSDCTKKDIETFTFWTKDIHEQAAAAALLPIPFAWLAVYVVIWIGRWIRAGFRRA